MLTATGAALAGPVFTRNLHAAESEGPVAGAKSEGLIDEPLRKAIDRGLTYLARKQVTTGKATGSFGGPGYAGGVAVCGLAGMALMMSGSTPSTGPYMRHIKRCVDFLLGCTHSSGYISAPSGRDRMYGHGFATLFLTQAYGMSRFPDRDSRLGKKLRSAVKLMVDTQSDVGGWRYSPRKNGEDLSITICQIMALRAAHDAGLFVPKETRDRCLKYVKESQNPSGGFRYTPRSGSHSTFPLTAAGVVSLYSAGIYEGKQIEAGLKYLERQQPSGSISGSYYFYGQYYAAQAMWHAGGERWLQWYRAIRKTLLRNVQSDGSWRDPMVGPEFGTARALIIAQLPLNYLPVFAR